MAERDEQTIQPAATWRDAGRRRSLASVQLITTVLLIASIVIAATAVTIGIARAQSMAGGIEPDAGLLLILLAIAITAMGLLSAAAVRLAGRSRGR